MPGKSVELYFSHLCDYQRLHSSIFTIPYKIIGGKIYIWNSFNEQDIVVEINLSSSENSTSINAHYYNNDQLLPSNLISYQANISEALRFYLGSHPDITPLFGNVPSFLPSLHIFSNINISLDDLNYAINNHSFSDELASSLAGAALCNLDYEHFFFFLKKSEKIIPRIYYHLSRYILPTRKSLFCAQFYKSMEYYLCHYPDDIDCIISLIKFYLSNHKIDECPKYFSILINSVPFSPLAGITCAYISIYERKFKDALFFLNAAGYSLHWPVHSSNAEIYTSTQPDQNSPYDPEISELLLYDSPFVGANAEYFACASLLVKSLSQSYDNKFIKNLFQNFYKEIDSDFWSSYNISLSEWPNSTAFSYFIPPNTNDHFLFDDGLIPEINDLNLPPIFKNLPISGKLKDTLYLARKTEKTRQFLSNSNLDDQSAQEGLKIAIRGRDVNLFKKVINYYMDKEMPTDLFLMIYKAFFDEIDSNFAFGDLENLLANVNNQSIFFQNANSFLYCIASHLSEMEHPK